MNILPVWYLRLAIEQSSLLGDSAGLAVTVHGASERSNDSLPSRAIWSAVAITHGLQTSAVPLFSAANRVPVRFALALRRRGRNKITSGVGGELGSHAPARPVVYSAA